MNVMVRHDAELRVVIKCNAPGHSRPCEDTIVQAKLLDAHLTVQAVMHGKVSGYDSGISVKQSYKLVNPERDTLKNGELCACEDCVPQNSKDLEEIHSC